MRCAVVVHRDRLVDEGDSWGRVAARGVGRNADVPVSAEGLQVLAVESLAGCGGDEVVVLLILSESAAGAGKGGGEYGGSLHFGSMWFFVGEGWNWWYVTSVFGVCDVLDCYGLIEKFVFVA